MMFVLQESVHGLCISLIQSLLLQLSSLMQIEQHMGFLENKLHINIIFSIKVLALWCLLLGLWAPVFKTLPSMRHKKAKSCTLLSLCLFVHMFILQGCFSTLPESGSSLRRLKRPEFFPFVPHYRVIYIGKILEDLRTLL